MTCASSPATRPPRRHSGRRCGFAIAGRSSRRRSIANLAPTGPSRPMLPCGPPPPVRLRCSTTGSAVSAAGESRPRAPPRDRAESPRGGTVIGPALVLSVIVGMFQVSAYVFIRGRAGARVPLLVVAAVLGAWAGDTVGGRMAIDPLRIGEFHLLSASFVAWLGIGLVAVLAVLVPEGHGGPQHERVSTVVRRASPAIAGVTGATGVAGIA